MEGFDVLHVRGNQGNYETSREIASKETKRSLKALFALCLTLSFGLVQTFIARAGGQGGAFVREMFGAILIFEDADAYVLVGRAPSPRRLLSRLYVHVTDTKWR
jgi:hypothetical protein